MKLTKELRSELRRRATVAREATGSGEWSQEAVGSCVMGVASIDGRGFICDGVAECVEFDAADFIAAADPDMVTALLDDADVRDALLRAAAADFRQIEALAPPGSAAEALAGKAAAKLEAALAAEPS